MFGESEIKEFHEKLKFSYSNLKKNQEFTFPKNLNILNIELLLKMKRREYQIIKNQWASILPEQEEHFSHFRDQKRRIGKKYFL